MRRCLAVFPFLLRRPGRSLAAVALLALAGAGAGLLGLHLWGVYHYRAAGRDLERHCTAAAREHLRACLWLWPTSAEVHLRAARAARQADDFTDAEQHLERCQHLLGRSDESLVLERALLQAQRGEPDPVLKYCQSLVEKHDPATPLVLEALARGYLRGDQLPQAEFAVTVWRERQPDSPQAFILAGMVREQRGAAEAAVEHYRRALALDPDCDEARLRLAHSLLETSQPAEAADLLEDLRRWQPHNPVLLVDLARCRHHLGRPDEAAALLDDVLAHWERFPPALTARGRVALQTGDVAGAERWLRQAAARAPMDYETQYLLYHALVLAGKEAEAREALEQADVLHADNSRLRDIAVVQLLHRPHDAGLLCEAGVILLRHGEPEGALRWLNRALKEDPGHRPTHAALADYYERTGDHARAVQHRERARPPAGTTTGSSGAGSGR
jgi:tetratricopeptide (TPR) repeat protein